MKEIFRVCAISIILYGISNYYNPSVKVNTNNRNYQIESLAYLTIEDDVKQKLKSPSSAKFPPLLERKNHVRDMDQGTYIINSWVDSDNSFGANIRTPFTAVCKCTSRSCRVESLIFGN